MKAYVLKEAYKIEEIEIDEPVISEPDDVLIDVKVVGICGSDMLGFQGKHELLTYPRVLGHEFSGIVEDVGAGVTGIKAGDAVIAEPLISCGECKPCRTGDYNVCVNLKVLGVHADGACQEKIVVKADKVFKIPPGATLKEGAVVEPICVGLEISRRGRLSIEDTLVIFGAGAIGLCTLKVARCHRPRMIISVDIDDDRLKMAKDMGADHTVNSAKENLQERIEELTDGEGASLVMEATGAEAALEACFTVTAYRARVAILGFYKSPLVQIPPIHIVKKELDIYGSRVYNHRFPLALDLLAKGEVELADIITHEFPFDQVEQAIKTGIDPNVKSLKVIVTRS